jgi:hypothetical protein
VDEQVFQRTAEGRADRRIAGVGPAGSRVEVPLLLRNAPLTGFDWKDHHHHAMAYIEWRDPRHTGRPAERSPAPVLDILRPDPPIRHVALGAVGSFHSGPFHSVDNLPGLS